MRIAALYDIHGNLPALEAVLGEVADWSPDLVVIGGDVVPGPMPGGCLARLRSLPWPTRFIYGNGETDVVAVHDGSVPARVPEAFHPALRWVADALDGSDRDALAAWPLTAGVDVEDLGAVLFCHATPRDDNEIFTGITPDDALAPVLDVGARVVVCGHTHMQFDRTVGEIRVVNAGSVGFPFGDTQAGWVTLEPGALHLRRTEYDLEEAGRRIAETGYPIPMDLTNPPDAADMLRTFEAAALRS